MAAERRANPWQSIDCLVIQVISRPKFASRTLRTGKTAIAKDLTEAPNQFAGPAALACPPDLAEAIKGKRRVRHVFNVTTIRIALLFRFQIKFL